MPYSNYTEYDDDGAPKPAKPNRQIAVAGLKDAISGEGYVPDAPEGYGGGGYTRPKSKGIGSLFGGWAALLRKGGLIDRPTLGVIGEAGPEAVIPLSQPVQDQEDQLTRYQGLAKRRKSGDLPIPEAPETLQIQVEQLGQGKRKMVLFTPGAEPQKRPEGIRQMRIDEGTVFYDPVMITPEEIKKASAEDALNNVLGDIDEGYGAPNKSGLKGKVTTITAHSREGIPAQDIATDDANLPRSMGVAKRLKPSGGGIIVHSPHEAIRMRVRSHTLKKMAGGGYGDQYDPIPALTGEAGPEANINLDDDPESQRKLLAYYRSLVMPDSAQQQKMQAQRNVLDQRTPGYVPKKPGLLQMLAAGAVGAGAGYVNSGGKRMNPVDAAPAARNILYPGLDQKAREYDEETKRLTGGYERERQAETDKFGQLGKIGQYENIKSQMRLRQEVDQRAKQGQLDREATERETFQKNGGRFQSTAPQAAEMPGLPPTVIGPGGESPEPQQNPQFMGPQQPQPPQVQAPGVMITPSNPYKIGGPVGNPEGFENVPGLSTDPKGYRRTRETTEHAAVVKKEAEQANWMEITPQMAAALPELGLTPKQKVPKESYDKILDLAGKKVKDPSLHFTTEVDDRGNLTVIGLDPATGQQKSATTISGVGKTKAPQGEIGTWEVKEDADGKATLFNSRTGETKPAPVRQAGTKSKEQAAEEKLIGPARDSLNFAEAYLKGGKFDATSDEALLENFFNLTKPSSGFRMNQAQIQVLFDSRNIMESLKAHLGHWFKTGGPWFSDDQRSRIVNTMRDVVMAKDAPGTPLGTRQAGGGALASQPQGSSGAPPVGTVVDGFRFKGGNHRDKANWDKVKAP